MPKSRHQKRRQKKNPSRHVFFNIEKRLEKIAALIDSGEREEALLQLEELAVQAPNKVEVYEMMFLAAVQLEHKEEMLEAAIRLVELQPYVPAHHFNLYGVYIKNLFPALALQTAHYFLQRWPDLELGQKMGDGMEKLESGLREQSLEQGLDPASWLDLLALHEKVQVANKRNRHEQAQQLATELIRLAPRFVPAYNNRSLCHWRLDNMKAAIADARKVLEIDPGNAHALGNLVRFFLLDNQFEEAQAVGERLKTLESQIPDAWTKRVEALSFLQDYAAVLEVAEAAEQAGILAQGYPEPLFYYFTGVAAARLGQEKKARTFLQTALKHAPALQLAQEQLHDLDRPLGERNASGPFELYDWLPYPQAQELIQCLKLAIESKQESLAQARLKRYLKEHPQVATLLPVLLERGDPMARELVLRLAEFAATPELLEVLHNFALSPHGPDKLRFEALKIAQAAGIIKNGEIIKIWKRGEHQEMTAHNYKVDNVPYEKVPPRAAELARQAHEAIDRDEWGRAEQLLSEALRMMPNSASLQYNLATVKFEQGDLAGTRATMEALTRQHPRYVFALCHLALMEIANERKQRASELLGRAVALDHFHYEEFAVLCKAQIFYFLLLEKSHASAEKWLDIWLQMMPEDERAKKMRKLVKNPILGRLQASHFLAGLRE